MQGKKYIQLSLFPEDDACASPQLTDEHNPHANEDEAAAMASADYDLTDLFDRLAKSAFRSRFRLSAKDRAYIAEKGLPTIRRHAEDFVAKRLAPSIIPNDGRQTPMRGHPVFLAQHATGCCCRGCLAKWHGISAGRQLTEAEQHYAVAVLMEWIERQMTL